MTEPRIITPSREANFQNARVQGIRARDSGKPLSSNPYPPATTQHDGFAAGWHVADQDRRRR